MEPVPPRRAFFRALVGADRAPPADRVSPPRVSAALPVATVAQRRNRPPAGIPAVRA